eukprot:46289_1
MKRATSNIYRRMTLEQKFNYQTTPKILVDSLTKLRMKYLIVTLQMEIATSSNASLGSGKGSLSIQMREHFERMKFKNDNDLRRVLNEIIRMKRLPRSENYKLTKRIAEIVKLGADYSSPFEFTYSNINTESSNISDDDDDDDLNENENDSSDEPIHNQFKDFKFTF